ncbi:enoyl-CoA hydratase-related protein [Sphingomonas panacis]
MKRMAFKAIRYETEGRVATITLNCPEKRNPFNVQMRQDMVAAFDLADADDEVRAIIVTGEGPAFCAGADLGPGGREQMEQRYSAVTRPDGTIDYAAEAGRDGAGLVALRIYRCLKPVIGAINGPAVGAGATITLPMDVRVAADTARFGFIFSRIGLVPEGASTYFLPRLIGVPKALDWLFSGRFVSADDAREAGMVQRIVPPGELLATARAIAQGYIEGTSAVSMALIRQMIWRGIAMTDPMEAHKVEAWALLARGRGGDFEELRSARGEGRGPRFTDRVSNGMPDFFPWWVDPDYA